MTKITLTIEDNTKAEEFLKSIKNNEFINIESILNDEYIDSALMASEKAIKYGQTISQMELEKEINNWRKK